MAQNDNPKSTPRMKIEILKDGPYYVSGGVPLVHKTQIVSEHGEPLTWKKDGPIECETEYKLCRCGQSSTMPFCDDTHLLIGFDGSMRADTGPRAPYPKERLAAFRAKQKIYVEKNNSLCMSSGFCGFQNADWFDLMARSEDSQVRSLLIAMVERCPSGSLSYRFGPAEPPLEPDLPIQIADTTEITDDGPIAGPLWVTGGIEIVRSDGVPFEPRNRVTLCNCGKSGNKPLCDGMHRAIAEREARLRRKSGAK